MYREVLPITPLIELSQNKHHTFFGAKYQPTQYSHLDENGIVKKGSIVNPHDLLVVGVTKTQLSGTDLILGRISKSLTKPFREIVLTWEHTVPGEIIEVVRSDRQVAILIKTQESMQIGDKLSGRHGNKGVVARIIPDHEILQDAKGKPIDVLLTSAGVVSRINPSQIIETAVAKVAAKTGKAINYDPSHTGDTLEWVKGLLKKHGVEANEHLYDPIKHRTISGHNGEGVFVGPQYIFKLFKSTDTNFSGHAVGPHDLNEQPVRQGGEEGAKAYGKMEFDALLAHNERAEE
jgi:DNA-directed RNA polymerase subunit beta